MLDHPSQSIPGGTVLGRYAIVELVGMGGVAEVYEAVHLGLHKRVALKVLRKEVREHPEVRARFLREGKNAAMIRHPNVVDIYDVGEIEGLPYLVMEHLEGESLASKLARRGSLAVQEIAHIMLPVISGVAAGHDQEIVHRDLKPENIFLSKDGRHRTTPKVLDFGVSRALAAADGLTLPDTAIGTPHYMAPEQARGERPVTTKMDQYSLGVMLYELCTGRLPRQEVPGHELMEAIAFGDFEPPSKHWPEMSRELEAVILKAMASKADDRYPTVRQMGTDLVHFASSRARDHWASEFGDEPVPSRPRRATDRPPPKDLVEERLKGSVPRLKAKMLPSLWDEDERTEFTDISSIIDKLPPDAQKAMHRWREVRRERISTAKRSAAKRGPGKVDDVPLERIAQPKPVTPAASAASLRRRPLPLWPILALTVAVGLFVVLLVLTQ